MVKTKVSATRTLVECAMLVALAFALSAVSGIIPSMPFGGSFTILSTLPIIAASLRHGGKWGVATAMVYSVTQLMMGMGNVVAVPVKTLWYMVLCALLDYVLAYSVLGFAGPIAKRFKNAVLGLVMGILITGMLRFTCSVVSGIIVWDNILSSGFPSLWYSLGYNATWCMPDLALVLIAAIPLSRIKALGLVPPREDTKTEEE
jgi:Predicted membrane protein